MGQIIEECGLIKFCGRQPLKNLKRYGLLWDAILVHSWILCLKWSS